MNLKSPLSSLHDSESFIARHIGPDENDIQAMLAELDYPSLDALISATLPAAIALGRPLALDAPSSEQQALQRLRQLAQQNQLCRSYIGLGYYDTVTPPVILRNVLENPGWYTAYTPYQPEISQGRLETLLAYQQMVLDLTGMELANASLLDESTAAAEAMALAKRVSKAKKANVFFIDESCYPQTIDVIKTRASCFGFDIVVGPAAEAAQHDVFGAIFQYPNCNGEAVDLRDIIEQLHQRDAIACVAADLMSLALLSSPGELGADVVVGNTQRFGVPMGMGGPHAAYFATRDDYKRAVPGRIIGVSVDARGKQAYRMSLQTREQHIRREKANSNICTAQVLLANIAALYAMYHGPEGIRKIALRIHRLTRILATGLANSGLQLNSSFFDTLTVSLESTERAAVLVRAKAAGVNLRDTDADTLGVSLDECSSVEDLVTLWQVFLGDKASSLNVSDIDASLDDAVGIPATLQRQSEYLQHPVFNRYHNETDMLRYLKRLENRDLSLTHAMIPLGSCTMKLNATAEMQPVTWPEFSKPHPFVPREQVKGYLQMIGELEDMLAEICGFDAVSMQPNSGAQGEYAGLLAIRRYLDSQGQQHRNVCLIPSSAHGTNPASAQMLSMKVVVVACDKNGNIDINDLKAKAEQYSDTLAALMITYPSTHGVFEESVKDICQIVHDHGGQVYMDGANLNAQVGVSRPGDIGADVSHVNLHKTFCIPHGGGGPGMGPIGIKKHLAPFVANHPVVQLDGPLPDSGAVSAAPWGSASILPISWMYIAMMGASGLLKATQVAILSANYIARQLSSHYPVLYTGKNGRVAHECIIDLRPLKAATGITEEDVAKRLMDYGFHAPTMSFPVPGTLMIEPTESEPKAELDRFIEAMICIRQEIARVASGELDAENNMLRHAPHTLADIMDDSWDRPYSKQEAAFPVDSLRDNKFWPAVNRIDNVYGDRNLFCACPAIEIYT
ncbi:aminomethyl-transferring glycine dehydrogenase [Pseudohongiella sp. SYSU M77423]|uniref:aminomethyl-transferring glycine dehydrogenase n=1 Tax=Pseudohongiella sp. SYSU M77423 TaxID=3042312 RepID=UPI002480F258|nr:aminomethyl-transferring glycine dehydrogenase [Pseudohongiella sp. SYSU M77423]MDH7942764.1 aminomethyl-transferring glycine dehydrogenase [Pseudohongiella sp. SYSU M77423]